MYKLQQMCRLSNVRIYYNIQPNIDQINPDKYVGVSYGSELAMWGP